MKIKTDFVTNSSSTSFVFLIQPTTKDLKSFLDKFNQFIREYSAKNSWRDDFETPPLVAPESIQADAEGNLMVREFLPFYTDNEDLPGYIRDLIALAETGADLSMYGIKKLSFRVQDANRSDSG
jgi:hypothetical protein